MPGQKSVFVRSRLGRKIFFAFLLITAIPLICISLLSKEISAYVLAKATDQLLRDSTKSVALNLLDRLRGAEAILKILSSSKASNTPNDDATARGQVVFSAVRFEPLDRPLPAGKPHVRVASPPDSSIPSVVMEIADERTGKIAVGVLNPTYLWENLESALYTMCVGGEEFAQPYCQGAERPQSETIEIDRPFYFRPYFEGRPWTLLAIAAPDIADYLPVRITAIFSYVAAASLLLALTVSAFFIRRATTPLDALIAATNAIRHRDFTHVVPLEGMKDEFKDVAASFNVMAATIGSDVSFMQVLAAIDEAILEHRPLGTVIQLTLRHLSLEPEFARTQIAVADTLANMATTYRIKGPDNIGIAAAEMTGHGSLELHLPDAVTIARTETVAAYLLLPARLRSLTP